MIWFIPFYPVLLTIYARNAASVLAAGSALGPIQQQEGTVKSVTV